MLQRPRTWLGLFLSLAGIALVRFVSTMVGLEELATLIYLLGVTIALGGLALVASAIRVTSVSVIPCPKCYLANSAEADRCARCSTPLRDDDKGCG